MFKKFVAFVIFFCAVLSTGKPLEAGSFGSSGGEHSPSNTHSVTAGKKTVFRHHLDQCFKLRSKGNNIDDWQFDDSEKSNTEKLVAAVWAKKPQQDDSSNEDTSTDSSKD